MPLGISIEFSVVTNDYNKKVKNANLLAIKKILIAVAGPLTNLLIVCICLLLKNYIILDENIFSKVVYMNILIAIFNLIPIYPLDGGRILKSFIHIIKGNRNSINYTNYISNLSMILLTMLASVAIYYYQNIAILLIVAYLWGVTIMENRKYKLKSRVYKIVEKSFIK